MDPSRLEQLFARAVGLPEAEQARFAARACGADLQLCAALLRLLAAHAGADHLQQLGLHGADRRRRAAAEGRLPGEQDSPT